MNKEKNPDRTTSILLSGTLLFIFTFISFFPAAENNFVNWDDGSYVYENEHIKKIDSDFFHYILKPDAVSYFEPVTLFSFAIDYYLWGQNPRGYHLTNILIHSLNTLLVFLLLTKLFEYKVKLEPASKGNLHDKNAVYFGCIAAICFGIHPLRVESVVWISERKDLLCAFFYVLTLLFYLKYQKAVEKKRKRVVYFLCLLSFLMALMSKPMAVSLPVVLFLIDYFPLYRVGIKKNRKNILWVITEKIPFFLLSLIVSSLTISAQEKVGALKTVAQYPLMYRWISAMHTVLFYIVKILFPINLAPFYPHPKEVSSYIFPYGISIFCTLCIFFWSIRYIKKSRAPITLFLFFIVTLTPVLGIVQVGSQVAADRYTYLPGIGPGIFFSFMLMTLCIQYRKKRFFYLPVLFLGIVFTLYLQKTVRQTMIWKNSTTLWAHTLKVSESYVAHYNFAMAKKDLGKFYAAQKHFNKAISYAPWYAPAYNNLGNTYLITKNYPMAENLYKQAIALNSKNIETYYNLALSLDGEKKDKEAISYYEQFIKKATPKYSEQISQARNRILYLKRYMSEEK